MNAFRFKHVRIASFATHFSDNEVTSSSIEDKLSPIYEKLGLPFGTLEKVSGISTRYLWDRDTLPSDIATVAAKKAIELSGLDISQFGAVFSCSVARDSFEPATGVIVHRKLGIPEAALAFDISNACIGFTDGVLLMGNLIESGVIKAGIVVSGETVSGMIENSINYLLNHPEVSREDLLLYLPTFTLGSGAVAWVLAHDSLANQLSTESERRIVGAVARSATEHSELCSGNGDFCVSGTNTESALMRTESSKIINSASKLGARLWPDFNKNFGWSSDSVDHIFCHQVGRQVGESFYREMSLDVKKEFTIYRKYGNLVSAALPSAVAIGANEKPLKSGSKVLLTAFGSGLNGAFVGIEW